MGRAAIRHLGYGLLYRLQALGKHYVYIAPQMYGCGSRKKTDKTGAIGLGNREVTLIFTKYMGSL